MSQRNLFAELKQRNVYKVAVAYAADTRLFLYDIRLETGLVRSRILS